MTSIYNCQPNGRQALLHGPGVDGRKQRKYLAAIATNEVVVEELLPSAEGEIGNTLTSVNTFEERVDYLKRKTYRRIQYMSDAAGNVAVFLNPILPRRYRITADRSRERTK